jgi:hypothetical protein
MQIFEWAVVPHRILDDSSLGEILLCSLDSLTAVLPFCMK